MGRVRSDRAHSSQEDAQPPYGPTWKSPSRLCIRASNGQLAQGDAAVAVGIGAGVAVQPVENRLREGPVTRRDTGGVRGSEAGGFEARAGKALDRLLQAAGVTAVSQQQNLTALEVPLQD